MENRLGNAIRNKIIGLIKTLVIPIITYGYPVFSNLTVRLSAKLQAAFNSCTRFVLGIRKYDSMGNRRNIIFGCTLSDFLTQMIYTSMFKIVKLKEPDYLYSRLKFSRSLRTRCLVPITRKLASYNGMFFIKGLTLWNDLPYELKCIQTITVFKSKIKSLFQ